MKTQQRRDEDTVTIMSGLVLGALVIGVGFGVLALADWLLSVPESAFGWPTTFVCVGGVVASAVYVARRR